MSRLNIYFIILLFLSTACSKSEEIEIPEKISEYENVSVFPADSEPQYTITLDRQTVYGDTEEIFLGSWLSAAVDDRERVFIADHQNNVLHLYNPDGTYNRQIGQEGEGPGEYRSIQAIHTDQQYLHLMDSNLRRITRYNLNTFEVADEISIDIDRKDDEPYLFPIHFFPENENTYLLQLSMSVTPDAEQENRFVEGRKIDITSGELSDSTFFSFPATEALIHRESNAVMVMSVPFNRKSVVRYRNRQLIYGWSENFLLEIYDEEGSYERAIYYSYKNPPLNRNEILKSYADRQEQWQNIVRNADMPDTMPVFNDFFTDDEGRIWVKKLTENRDEVEYVVLENTGELLAEFTWPAATHIQEIKNGFLYVLETEEETGLSEIVKYEISFDKI
ncbi:MAG: 6-bladed beta-propeller [Bacteroidetes bacterium]|jgi:hypothetical protein|nr:6-bladed beta-propeller [Bacteroidota bacterium]